MGKGYQKKSYYKAISDQIFRSNQKRYQFIHEIKDPEYHLVDHVLSIRADSNRRTVKYRDRCDFCHKVIKTRVKEHKCHYCVPCLKCSKILPNKTICAFHYCSTIMVHPDWYSDDYCSKYNICVKASVPIFRSMTEKEVIRYHSTRQIWVDELNAFKKTEPGSLSELIASSSYIGWLPYEVLKDIQKLM